MDSDKVRQIANGIGVAAVVAFNFISQGLPLNGLTSAEIANRYPDLLYFPANYAFSIWGLIYTFLIAFGVYQALPGQRSNPALRRIGYLFVLTCVFNIAWLTCFHFLQFPLSMVMMILLLGTLLAIYLRLDIGGAPVNRATKWLVHVPFSLYLGWITAATITNAAYMLTDAGWNGFGLGDETWALIMLVVTGIVAAAMIYRRRDIAYGLVIVWAVSAIAVRHGDITPVLVASVAVCLVVGGLVLYAVYRHFDGNRMSWAM